MKALIFGAGKIARGFIGQLLFRSGFEMVFVEYNKDFADALDQAGRYYVNVMGNLPDSEWISGYRCFSYDHMPQIAEALKHADVIFTSVIGSNLPTLGRLIAQAYEMETYPENAQPRTIICCENWKKPAELLRSSILEALSSDAQRASFQATFGLTDAVIMRSGVEPTEEVRKIDPLAVSVHNYWDLPINKAGIKGMPIDFKGARYLDNFQGFLQQKVFTYNGGNATIAYLGRLKGYVKLCDAANDPEIERMLLEVYREINPSICKELNILPETQEDFMYTAIHKYQDRNIDDFIERHARDPLRKLGPEDRIVGVARMIERQGLEPIHEARTLAAALHYTTDNPDDPSAEKLRAMREEKGIDYILKTICGIDPNENLARLVHLGIAELKQRGWIHEA